MGRCLAGTADSRGLAVPQPVQLADSPKRPSSARRSGRLAGGGSSPTGTPISWDGRRRDLHQSRNGRRCRTAADDARGARVSVERSTARSTRRMHGASPPHSVVEGRYPSRHTTQGDMNAALAGTIRSFFESQKNLDVGEKVREQGVPSLLRGDCRNRRSNEQARPHDNTLGPRSTTHGCGRGARDAPGCPLSCRSARREPANYSRSRSRSGRRAGAVVSDAVERGSVMQTWTPH